MAFLWPSCGSLALSVLCTRIRILFILRKNPFIGKKTYLSPSWLVAVLVPFTLLFWKNPFLVWEKTIFIGKPLAILGKNLQLLISVTFLECYNSLLCLLQLVLFYITKYLHNYCTLLFLYVRTVHYCCFKL